jgi:hypothetical protein
MLCWTTTNDRPLLLAPKLVAGGEAKESGKKRGLARFPSANAQVNRMPATAITVTVYFNTSRLSPVFSRSTRVIQPSSLN